MEHEVKVDVGLRKLQDWDGDFKNINPPSAMFTDWYRVLEVMVIVRTDDIFSVVTMRMKYF